jgi:AAA15 family ATPase/GTPase
MPKLTAIELEKFQTISSHTVIPIRNLTLMFGPNGAGKSSIFDALELMEVLFSEDWGKGNKKLLDYLDRWARKEDSESPNNEIGFGLQVLFEESWSPDYLPLEKISSLKDIDIWSILSSEDNQETSDYRNFRFFIKFKRVNASFSEWFISNLIIERRSEKILEITSNENTSSRLDIYNHDWTCLLPEILLVNKEYSLINHYQTAFYSATIDTSLYFLNPNYWLHGDELRPDSKEKEVQNHLTFIGQKIINFFKVIFTTHFFTLENDNLPLVKASRTVPKSHEVITLIYANAYKDGKEFYSPQRIQKSLTLKALVASLNQLEPHWAYLSASLGESLSKQSSEEESPYWDELDSIKKINSMLREDLFIDNGYQLSGDVLCLTSIEELSEIDLLDIAVYYPKIVRLFLLDQKQRKVEIEDVGSGIGYILPVLAALAHKGRSLIQQPELHLHPALQSALGDAIIRSVENYKYFDQFCLIETHSEHLLLRILKLIKNSSKREEETISPLTFDNLSLLYFEPKSDGSTKVKRLRVSPDGKLIDRWPGGFFNERYKDLFDDE